MPQETRAPMLRAMGIAQKNIKIDYFPGFQITHPQLAVCAQKTALLTHGRF